MSLINDVLRDLEGRRANAAGSDALADLHSVRIPTTAPGRRWLLPATAALLASSAFAIRYIDNEPSPQVAVMTVPAGLTESTAAEPLAEDVVADRRMATLIDFTRSLDALPRRTARSVAASAIHSPPSTAPLPVERKRRAQGAEPPGAPREIETAVAKVPASNALDDGLGAMADGEPEVAERHFRVLVERRPQQADGWLYLSRALDAQGRRADAESSLSDGLVAVTDAAPIARALARHLLERRAIAEALKLLEAYRPSGSLDPEHDAFIAALHQRLGRHDIAAERYRGVLAVRPEAAAWWVGLAISEEARGRGGAALNAYRHARNIGNLDSRLADYAEKRMNAMQGSDRT